MTTDVLHEVVETYEARRRVLEVEARNARALHNTDLSDELLDASERLRLAAEDEIRNIPPPGMGGKWYDQNG